jgi:hypothetical protein
LSKEKSKIELTWLKQTFEDFIFYEEKVQTENCRFWCLISWQEVVCGLVLDSRTQKFASPDNFP